MVRCNHFFYKKKSPAIIDPNIITNNTIANIFADKSFFFFLAMFHLNNNIILYFNKKSKDLFSYSLKCVIIYPCIWG